MIFEILTIAGLWVIFAKCRGKKMGSAGITLVKVPLVINFIFYIIGFPFTLASVIMSFNIVNLFVTILTFIFNIMYFSSINKLLNLGKTIANDRSAYGNGAGMFAAVAIILMAIINLISALITPNILTIIMMVLSKVGLSLSSLGLPEVAAVAGIALTVNYVYLAITFIIEIYAAVMIIMFNKKLKA